ncbi:MAG: glycosyltransferase family 9 protein [Candidatus Thorarchaeota archaeon]
MKKSLLKSVEHGVKRIVFGLSQIHLKKGRTEFQTVDPDSVRRVLFIRPEKLGDMVISLPVFHNLKTRYPHLELYTISSPRNIAIVQNNEHIKQNFLYTKNIVRDLGMLRSVRSLRVDAVVDMVCDDSVTALFLTQYSSRNAWRIGVGKNRHRTYYDFNYEYRTGDEAHVVDNTLRLLTAFGIDCDSAEKYVPPTIPDRFFQSADEYIASLNGDAPGGIIGVNISAGRPTRVWQNEKTTELIHRLLVTYPSQRIIISSDPKERDRAVALAKSFGTRVDPLPPGLNLLEVAAVISRMKLLITPDTSLVHIARSFKVPVVGLYTRFQKNFTLWRPYGQLSGAVVSGNDYNIFDIEVDDVYTTAIGLLPPEDTP